jgi:hypothetical protein
MDRPDVEAESASETSVNFYQTTRRNNPEDSHLRIKYMFQQLLWIVMGRCWSCNSIIFWNLKFHSHVHKIPSLDPIASQLKPVLFILTTLLLLLLQGETMFLWNWASMFLYVPFVHLTDDTWVNMEQWWNDADRKNRKTWRKTCSSATLTTSLTSILILPFHVTSSLDTLFYASRTETAAGLYSRHDGKILPSDPSGIKSMK